MEINRIQSFRATINGVEFSNERRFDVVEYILHLIEYEFRIEVTTQFVEDLDELVGDLRLASEFTFVDIEIILRDCVLESKSFETLQFNIKGLDDCTDYINEQLASGAYKAED